MPETGEERITTDVQIDTDKRKAGLPFFPSLRISSALKTSTFVEFTIHHSQFKIFFLPICVNPVRHEALSISVGENPMQVIGLSLGRREDGLNGDVKDRSSLSRSVGRNVST